jgi:D-amino-acid dehydrogenase
VYDVALIGGGIVGVACALELAAAGRSVAIVEAGEPGAGTAGGSAGYLSDGEIFPLAQPGVLRDLPELLFDPKSPLVVDPRAMSGLLGWGVRFVAAARPAHARASMRALASLNRPANDALYALAERAGAAAYLKREGALHVARAPEVFAHARSLVPLLAAHGLSARVVERDELLRLEPALAPNVAGAVEYPNAMRCTDPAAFGAALATFAREQGVAVVKALARGLEARRDGTWRIRASTATVDAARVVVTAGVWSRDLLRPLGYVVPLQAARGYHLMLSDPGVTPRRTLLFEDAHFCATPMDGGLRLAGTMEFAPLGAPPRFGRASILFPAAAVYLPGLRAGGAVRWMGNRPSFPDSLPAIGTAFRHQNLYYCFGHEKLGLTQAAISARVVAALVAGKPAPLDLTPFALERFLGLRAR